MLGIQEMHVKLGPNCPSHESVIYLFGDVAVATGTASLPGGISQIHRTTNAFSMPSAQGSVEDWCSYFDSVSRALHVDEAR